MRDLSPVCCLLAFIAGSTAFAQAPPPNDNFTNAILLTGNQVNFSGSLTNATLEDGEPPLFDVSTPTRSVWWKWAPVTAGPVLLQVTSDYSYASGVFADLQIFRGGSISNLEGIDGTIVDAPSSSYLIHSLYVPTNAYYYIRVIGNWQGSFNVQLTASAKPVILQQPEDCATSPYGSAVFSAQAAGIPAPAYQWMFNDTPLAGQTAAILLVHSVQTNAAGRYSVIASNSGGVTQSATAWLTVADTNPVPRVTLLPPTNGSAVQFVVQGEGGRWYRCETTDDLTYWWLLGASWYGRATNEFSLFSVPVFNSEHQFVSVSLDARTDGCVAHLKAFHSAVSFLTRDQKLRTTATYTVQDLAPYFAGGAAPQCPGNGAYYAGATVTNNVTCSITGGYFGSGGHHWP